MTLMAHINCVYYSLCDGDLILNNIHRPVTVYNECRQKHVTI